MFLAVITTSSGNGLKWTVASLANIWMTESPVTPDRNSATDAEGLTEGGGGGPNGGGGKDRGDSAS
eukprot:scaffold4078_cov68-Phaeocystis_antarctica.AAC.6